MLGETQAVKQPSVAVIFVERGLPLVLPDGDYHVVYPNLEDEGPNAFQPESLEPWLHVNQKSGAPLFTEDLFFYLEQQHMRGRCLGLSEAVAIKKMGADFFRQHFRSDVLCYKFVIQRSDGIRFIPMLTLSEDGKEVELQWYMVDCRRNIALPVYLFPQKS